MSRDTDSSSSGSQGRGGPAYPSGTPPYGPRPFPSLHPQERPRPADAPGTTPVPAEQPAEPAADEPRTETTLTTRIRINIPGSRPIPPVVVRTTMDEGAVAASAAAEAAEQEAAGAAAAAAAADAGPEPEKTSDWFAPRKSVAAPPGLAGPATPAGPDSGAVPGSGPGAGSGPGSGPGPVPGGGPGFADRSGGSGGNSGFTGQGMPHGAGSGADAFAGSGPGSGSGGPPGGPYGERRGADPYPDYDTGSHPAPPADPNASTGGFFRPAALDSSARGSHDNPAAGPESPFAPGAGSPFAAGTENFPPGVPRPSDPYGRDNGGARPYDAAAPSFAPPGGASPVGAPGGPITDEPFPGYQPPAGPTTVPATGSMQIPPVGPAGFRPPVPPGNAPPPEDRAPGDTLVSGIPAVPAGETRGPRPAGPAPRPVPVPEPVPAAATAAAAGSGSGSGSARPKKKRRSKVVLLGVAAGGVLVVAYGAGLLMNHADVPKGTTVLGVDIGNESTDQAGKSLDQALGDRTTAPMTLTIGGKKQTLKPSVAGLSFDTDATVREVAHSDYNPVSVIGSLFGGTRSADPVILVDEDKLKAALKGVASSSSTASDGMVRFEPNKIVPVPGKAGTSFDVDAAASQVAAAYHARAETGTDTPIALAVTTVQPKVTQAELNNAVHGFARQAMSHKVLVRANGLHFIQFGPTVSLPKVLTMVPDDAGHLQPHIDLTALKTLYGTTFQGVMLKRADGSTTAVTAQDVAAALLSGLDGTANKTITLPGVAG